MEVWHQCICAQMQAKLVDEEEDELFVYDLLAQIESAPKCQHGGFVLGHQSNLDQQQDERHLQILKEYFSSLPIYDDNFFHRVGQFCFYKIMNVICAHDFYFV
jgi:hypothetical protein